MESELDCLRDTYTKFGVEPESLQYLECHATGTPQVSTVELEPISPRYLPDISPISPLYLPYISPVGLENVLYGSLYLPDVSPISPLYLPRGTWSSCRRSAASSARLGLGLGLRFRLGLGLG